MDFLTENAGAIIQFITSLVGSFAIVATMTKNESDNKVADFLLKIINFFAANVGRSKNE